MTITGLNVLRFISANSQQNLKLLSKRNVFAVTSSCNFTTSNNCIQQSSEKQFLLRHQDTTRNTSSGWLQYRFASLGLLGGLASCCMFPGNMVVDFVTVTLLVYHNHVGIKSVIADYAKLFLPGKIIDVMTTIWLIVSILTLALLYNFNYNGVGFSKALTKFFSL